MPLVAAPPRARAFSHGLAPAAQTTPRTTRRAFASTRPAPGYAATIPHLRVGPHTRVLYQGFTGKQATVNAQQSLEWGTRIVGGVTPGREGEHLGLPVLPSVRRAAAALRPDASAVFVAAGHAARAIEEAVEAEVPLVVAVAEHIPVHDMLRISEMLQTQSRSRLVGANSPGIISAIGHCRIGFQPLPVYTPGHVGVVAKSGTLSYETVASLTRAGLGQSLCVGVGGDVVAGTNFVEALEALEADEDTHAIVLVGEVGGRAEEDAAEWIVEYRRRTSHPKPIAALVAGMCAQPGRIMGHAGAWAGPGEASAQEKYDTLERAGVTMVDHPSKFGPTMHMLLSGGGANTSAVRNAASLNTQQTRGMHTLRSRPALARPQPTGQQRRCLHLSSQAASSLLEPYKLDVSMDQPPADAYSLALTIDRSLRKPVIIAGTSPSRPSTRIPYPYSGFELNTLPSLLKALDLSSAPGSTHAAISHLLSSLNTIFKDSEALVLSVAFSLNPDGSLQLYAPDFSLDDAAYRSNGRVAALHTDTAAASAPPDPREVEAAKDGIVYIPLAAPIPTTPAGPSATERIAAPPPPPAAIGTLVNGAGLAMNTLDALHARHPGGPRAANFLDTGGKATAATIRACFALLLADPAVAVVLVNIFGGLTRCDMIADGLLRAYADLGPDMAARGVRVVVRLRGTNEAEGQQMVARSGLPVKAFDGFEDAVAEAVRLVEMAELEGRRRERLERGE